MLAAATGILAGLTACTEQKLARAAPSAPDSGAAPARVSTEGRGDNHGCGQHDGGSCGAHDDHAD